MDPHARTLDDALADLKRAIAARPGNPSHAPGPSGGPGIDPRARPPSRTEHGRNPGGSNANKARHHWPVASGNLPARLAVKIDPLTAVMVVLGIIVGFQQVSARIDRAHGSPQLIKLVFPSAEGLRDSRL